MSTSYDLDEIIPIEIGHGGEFTLISLGEFERYLTIFEGLLGEMDRSDGGYQRMGLPKGTVGGRLSVGTDMEGLLDVLEVLMNRGSAFSD